MEAELRMHPLQALSKVAPVPYNLDGSYLTMWSRGGLIFGIINLIGASSPHSPPQRAQRPPNSGFPHSLASSVASESPEEVN